MEPITSWLLARLAPQQGETVLELAAGNGETGLRAAPALGESGRLLLTDLAPAMTDGHGWARTSDLSRVKRALSH